MAFGYLSFCEYNVDTNINNIIDGNYEMPGGASSEVVDLLIHLLDINTYTRYDLEQIRQHPLLKMVKSYKYLPGVIKWFHRIPWNMKIVEAYRQCCYDKDRVIDSVQNGIIIEIPQFTIILLRKRKEKVTIVYL